MRKLLLFVSLLFVLSANGQSKMNLSIHQDVRLLFFGDNRGNEVFTPDLRAKIEFETFTLKTGSFYLYIGLEYADLSSSVFQRFFVGFGYLTEFSFLKDFSFGLYLDHGLLIRGEGKFMGSSLNFETSYPIAKKLQLSLLYQAIDRNDLTNMFNEERNIKGSVFFGVKLAL